MKSFFVKFWLKLYYKLKKNRGVFIVNKVWDNLIILDACRHDIFEKEIGKKVDHVISRGSATPEWLIENFKGKKHKDIVYVTANPFVDVLVKESFYKVIPVWKLAWNEKHGTVMPKDVVKYALIAKKMYPRKRLIVHFMQPHHPFVTHPDIKSSIMKLKSFAEGKRKDFGDLGPWELARRGKVSIQKVWQAYLDNLSFVLPYALRLAAEINGITVISSDHGNVFKKVKIGPVSSTIAGHPTGIHFEELVKVPWYIIKN